MAEDFFGFVVFMFVFLGIFLNNLGIPGFALRYDYSGQRIPVFFRVGEATFRGAYFKGENPRFGERINALHTPLKSVVLLRFSMPMSQSLLDIARQTIDLESRSVAALADRLGPDFERAVQALAQTKGRVIISGIGKSAVIAQKIVATFNSTGTPAVFMHAADAIHGDLGMILPEDVVVLISKSGESPEIKTLVPLIREFGNTLIALSGKLDSYLATHADIVIDTVVEQEACPNNLAPTTSTTAQLVMGDALAICLMKLRGFRSDDFARVHPGGALGKRLYLRVMDLAKANQRPLVKSDASVQAAILEMTQKRLGVTAVVDGEDRLLGIITDGDLRRMLEKGMDWNGMKALDIMTPSPKTIEADALAVEALEVLQDHSITQLVVTAEGRYIGIVHLHDLVREGLH